MYNYQKTKRYFAQVADDIKDIAEKELHSMEALETFPAYRGIYFTADPQVLYSVNYHSRLINRVLAPVISFNCHSDQLLYKKSLQVHWEDFLDTSQTFAVFATVSNSSINHSKFAALRLKDAVVDYFRERTGNRPSIDTINPDVWLNLYIESNKATISLDTSGGSLHRRGYRKETVQAPMIETLAAAIINYSGWDGSIPLYDPFCGSGTLLCEAYMHACHIPSAFLRRKFGFEMLPDFNSSLWKQIKMEGLKKIIHIPKSTIAGSDISFEATKFSIDNCSVIDKENVISIEQQDVFDIKHIEGKVIVCNPPYGIRMGKTTDLYSFYKNFGDFLKQRCHGSTAFIYFGERKYIKNIGLKPSWTKPLSAGGLDGRLVKYELY
ncbi:THUMP domain-containing protein [bacterium]|nr:THUMP domain-containing protein [bacterium]